MMDMINAGYSQRTVESLRTHVIKPQVRGARSA